VGWLDLFVLLRRRLLDLRQFFGIPKNCEWDDKYRKQGRSASALRGVFTGVAG